MAQQQSSIASRCWAKAQPTNEFLVLQMKNMHKVIELPTERESVRLGEMFGSCLRAPLTITFSGEIGAGKTTFIRILTQIIGPDSGEILLNGNAIQRSDIEQ